MRRLHRTAVAGCMPSRLARTAGGSCPARSTSAAVRPARRWMPCRLSCRVSAWAVSGRTAVRPGNSHWPPFGAVGRELASMACRRIRAAMAGGSRTGCWPSCRWLRPVRVRTSAVCSARTCVSGAPYSRVIAAPARVASGSVVSSARQVCRCCQRWSPVRPVRPGSGSARGQWGMDSGPHRRRWRAQDRNGPRSRARGG
jgi:hypothetical protein